MLGSLIGAGASILGGLLGGEEKQKGKSKTWNASTSTSTNKVHLGKMVRTAERNGFNPLTLLRAGGLAAFTDTTSKGSSFSKSKTKGTSSSSSPLAAGIAGAGSIIGGALDSGANQQAASAADAWQGLRATDATSSAASEMSLVNSQLASTTYGDLGTQPSLPVSTTYSAKPALSADPAGSVSNGGWQEPTFEKPTVTNPFPKAWGMKVDPNVPDAQAWESRYGGSEVAEMVAGLTVAGADAWNGIKGYIPEMPVFDNQLTLGRAVGDLTGNVWDPPAISLFNRPVVTHVPKPILSGGGAW